MVMKFVRGVVLVIGRILAVFLLNYQVPVVLRTLLKLWATSIGSRVMLGIP
jgi:hypothetical protein